MNPQQTLEKAAHLFASRYTYSDIARTSIYKGMENPVSADENGEGTETRVNPSITVLAEGGHEEIVLGTKVYRGALVVRVEANAQRITEIEFAAICESVFSKWDIVGLKDWLSMCPGFTCLHAAILDNGHAINNGVNWQNDITLDCVYAEAKL